MSYQNTVNEHVRLSVLRLLTQDAGYSHNHRVIGSGLEALGHALSGDAIKTQMQWLAEQGLVTTEEIAHFLVARLTDRGLEVAEGRALTPGVARPLPGE